MNNHAYRKIMQLNKNMLIRINSLNWFLKLTNKWTTTSRTRVAFIFMHKLIRKALFLAIRWPFSDGHIGWKVNIGWYTHKVTFKVHLRYLSMRKWNLLSPNRPANRKRFSSIISKLQMFKILFAEIFFSFSKIIFLKRICWTRIFKCDLRLLDLG